MGRDYVVIVGKKDEERFRQFKTKQNKPALQSIGIASRASNIWALNSHLHSDVWSAMKRGDRVFFAKQGSNFSNYGTVLNTLQDQKIAVKLWGDSPRMRSHDLLILFSSVNDIREPFHQTCRRAGITAAKSDGVYISQNPILGKIPKKAEKRVFAGVVTVKPTGQGPAMQTQEAVTRYIRDSKKAKQLKRVYKDMCQVCGTTIEISTRSRYSEVHHLRPISEQGDDDFDNMLVLCPNHHVEFDYKLIGLGKDGHKLVFSTGERTGEIMLSKDHRIAPKNIKFHLDAMRKNDLSES